MIEGRAGLNLLDRLRRAGKPLGEYVQGRFYYGIKTGFNDASVVDGATRDQLIAAHPSSAELLKRFLRGRDVKRWKIDPQDLWLIFTRRGCDIRKYPAIHDHLRPFKNALMPGGLGGRKSGHYQWYEIQDNIAYWREFEGTKVIYPDMYEHQSFAWDTEGHYLGNTCYFIPTDKLWFTALLNSPLVEWFYGDIANRIRGGYLRPSPAAQTRRFSISAPTAKTCSFSERMARARVRFFTLCDSCSARTRPRARSTTTGTYSRRMTVPIPDWSP